MAAAGGGPHPFTNRKVRGCWCTDRLSHLAQAQTAPIRRDEMWHPCPASAFEHLSRSSATDQPSPLGLKGRGHSASSPPFIFLPHLQKGRSLRGEFTGTKPGRIPSTFTLASASWQWVSHQPPGSRYYLIRPDDSVACPLAKRRVESKERCHNSLLPSSGAHSTQLSPTSVPIKDWGMEKKRMILNLLWMCHNQLRTRPPN